jgi:hypothetical protein
MKIMEDIIVKIWQKLDGNKTIICLSVVAIIYKMIELALITNSGWIQLITWLLMGIGTGTGIAHVQKQIADNNSKQ